MHARKESDRVELFRVLGDEGRLRILAVCAQEELSVGELCEVLHDSQPQVSRRAAPLRSLGLLGARREGTKTYLHLSEAVRADAVVQAALVEGQRLSAEDGTLERLTAAVRAREEAGRRFFEDHAHAGDCEAPSGPILAHLAALAPLLADRSLAVDVGCGDGRLLDVLAPLFGRVVAIDRSIAQADRARRRAESLGFSNVTVVHGHFDDEAIETEVRRRGGASVVFASRVLHHAARPQEALAAFARLLAAAGRLVLVDYLPHTDERLRAEGDVWLGFSQTDLRRLAESAGLAIESHFELAASLLGSGSDAHLPWQALVAKPRTAVELPRAPSSDDATVAGSGARFRTWEGTKLDRRPTRRGL